MKEHIYILFTAGRGPVECSLAVQGIHKRFMKYLDAKRVSYDIISEKKGPIPNSIETITFKLGTSDKSIIAPWIGTILWICQSPIRKSHKRKNWFIKGEVVNFSKKIVIDPNDVTVQTFRASGPGGQHRNKVETAVRLIHKASGIIATASDGKSQHQNKKKAWQRLENKLFQKNQQMQKGNASDQWNTQIQIERGSPVKVFVGARFREE